MIGLVVVARSRALAEAAVANACAPLSGRLPDVAIAADPDARGTDAAAVSLAIQRVDSDRGVLVFVDSDAAILPTELAVSFLDPDLADRVTISSAPLVEGLAAAMAVAASGGDLADADAAASGSLDARTGRPQAAPPRPTPVPPPPPQAAKPPKLTWRTPIDIPHGLHIRPAAAVITALRELDADVQLSNATTGAGPVPATSLARLAGLELRRGQVLEARIVGPDAERARDVLSDLAARQFGEGRGPRRPTRMSRQPVSPSEVPEDDAPTPSGSQVVVGPIHRRTSLPSVDGYHPRSPKIELVRFTEAVDEVEDYLDALSLVRPGSAEILQAQAALAADAEFAHAVVGRITEGFSAVDAVADQLTRMARTLDALTDPYLRERAQDVRSIRRLLLLSLMRRPLEEDEPGEPCVWLVDELDAATASRLDARLCLGVITTDGGLHGHGALTAESRGIPVLAGRDDARGLGEGRVVAFDPVTRELWVDPTDELLDQLDARNLDRAAAVEQARSRAHDPAYTLDGRRIRVEANVSSVADARAAARAGAEGSGVVRTEILFAARLTAPSPEEQAETYVKIGRLLKGTISIRTWDAGGDKPLAFLPIEREANPALGERGIRTMRRARTLLADQLRGIVLAARQTPVRVMFPMITHPDELRWARGVLDEVLADAEPVALPVGMMVEVPAAALRASDFAGLVDFVSIGTNDLAQYVLASDRTNAAVSALADPSDEAVWDLIALTCRSLPDVPVAVCGNLASDPGATARLVGLGVTELSVRPPLVAQVKQAVRRS